MLSEFTNIIMCKLKLNNEQISLILKLHTIRGNYNIPLKVFAQKILASKLKKLDS
jgi:hypothetical protein